MTELISTPEVHEQPDFRMVYLLGEGGSRLAWHWNKPDTAVDVARQGVGAMYPKFVGQILISTNAGQFVISQGQVLDVEASRMNNGVLVLNPVAEKWRSSLVVPIAGRATLGGSSAFIHSVLIDTGMSESPPSGAQQMPDVFAAAWESANRPYPQSMFGVPHIDKI